jgi:hypothetical protein
MAVGRLVGALGSISRQIPARLRGTVRTSDDDVESLTIRVLGTTPLILICRGSLSNVVAVK